MVIASFLEKDHDVQLMQEEGPQADAYEFQSEGVVTLFTDLEHKMANEKSDVEKDEANRQHAYRMLMQDLQNRMARTQEERDADIAEKAAKTVDIMSSKVALVQVPKRATAFVQLRANTVSPLQRRVAAFLQSRAKEVNSPLLALLAAKTEGDVFAKVKKMIDSMITKLMEEANAEAEQKAWCDTEMAANLHTRDAKTDESDKLSAEIEMLGATITKTTEDITNLHKNVASIDASVKQATADRAAERSKNAASAADAASAEEATAQALAVLKEFYAKAAEATALVQTKKGPNMSDVYQGSMNLVKKFHEEAVEGTPQADAPTSWTAAYQGSSASTGVLGLLEVIQSDFATTTTSRFATPNPSTS